MAQPIVRTFVIDTTQAEQSLQTLNNASKVTLATLDSLYNELIKLDAQLNQTQPDTESFTRLSASIKSVEDAITNIETSKFNDIATDINSVSVAANSINTDNISNLGTALTDIDSDALSNASNDINSIADSVDSIDPSQLSELDTALSSIDASNLTTVSDDIDSITASVNQIDSSNLEQLQGSVDSLGSGELTTVANDIESINASVNSLDSSNLNQLQLDFDSVDTSSAVNNIEAINDAASSIDVSNVSNDISEINASLESIDTTDAVTSIGEIETSLNALDAGNAISNIQSIDSALEGIDTSNVVTDIDNINSALSSIDASSAVAQVDSVNVALDAVDTSNVTGQIESINTELASVDVSTAINEIAAINTEFSKIDTTNVISEILGIGESVNQIDTSGVVEQIGAINTELNSIDATNVTADVSEISTAIESINASNAVNEITSIDTALDGIDTSTVVSDIEDISNATQSIDTSNFNALESSIEGIAPAASTTATALDDINDSAKNVDGSKVKELAPALDTVETSSKSLKAQLRELQAQLANTAPDSAKYRELSQAAGELKDRIQDAAQAVGTQAGGAFERVSGSLGLVTSRIANLDFEGAAEGAKLLAQNITQIKPADIAKGIQGIGSAFASIGKALLTNPIFLIGAAIAAAIVYAEELLSLIDGVTDAEQKALNTQKERAALAKEQVDAIGQQEESLKRQGLTEKQITDLKLKALDTAILEQQVVIETAKTQLKSQVEAAQRNAEYLKTFLDFVTFPQRKLAEFFQNFVNGAITVLNKLGLDVEKIDITSVFEDVNNFIVKKVFDPEQVKKDGEASLKEAEKTLVQLNNQRDGILNAQDAKEKAKAKEAADAKAKAAQDAADAQLKAEQEVSDLLNQLYEENLKEFEDAEKKKTAAAELEAAKRKKAEEDYDASIKALRAEQDAANLTQDQKEIIAIDNKYLDLREKAIQAGKSTVEVDAAYKAALEQQEKDSAEKRIATEQAVKDAKLGLASEALGSINALVGAFAKKDEQSAKRAFKAQKAISIAQATVDTYKGANAIFASAAANPATVLFPAQPFIAAGAAIAAGIANVATIAKQEFQGTAPAGGNENVPSLPGDTGGGSQPAQFNPLASAFLQDRPEQLTPRAYVLAGDVASAQEVRENVEDLSRLG